MSTLKNLTSSDLDASGSFVNINEDDSIPIRILKVSPTEIKLANGDVVPPTCIFLQGQTFVWTPPPVDPMTAMPSGKGWEAWTEDVWSIFDMSMPKPGTLLSHSHRNTCLRYRKHRFACASQDSFRIAWTERRYENGSLSATERWTAILTIVIETPRDTEKLRRNPLGVFVHALNWSKELG